MVALVIIYNHKFDKNIPILEDLYKGKFSNIFHLIPFYTGDKENVIPVYENSFYFQGYVSQAHKILKEKGDFDHFMFIGDDLFLNPEINENNYQSFFEVDNETSFLPDFIELSKRKDFWGRFSDAVSYRSNISGVEIKNEMPSYSEILNKFAQHNLVEPSVLPHFICNKPKLSNYPKNLIGLYRYFKQTKEAKAFYKKGPIKLNIPLVGSYSDVFIVTKQDFSLFSHYCGLFAASELFVELAIPTAMVMSCSKIKTESDLENKGYTIWSGEENERLADKNNLNIATLISNFPEKTLYIHPIKLSKWTKKE